ncbi:cytochrome c [Roseovarius sp. SCSIO 43702]|uniref:c-type cytochrome n=1 Tax=Roseovarius sp. SCSIO 43702 TaxID=2823043 RepID=UPI001C7374BA|nr:cytochrome c [Roseovarius sp. SCSIO 43702]QYX55302.1 cytochrome c [Roseovarius sp. SCSIO 43702]
MRRGLIVTGAAAGMAGALGLALRASDAGDSVALRDDPATLAQGREVYAEHCASCHGVDLEGAPNWRVRNADGRLPAPPHDASGHTWHHDSAALFAITKHGVGAMIGDPDYASDMPVYAGVLSDEEIVAVLSFIRSTWPAEIREMHEQRDANR